MLHNVSTIVSGGGQVDVKYRRDTEVRGPGLVDDGGGGGSSGRCRLVAGFVGSGPRVAVVVVGVGEVKDGVAGGSVVGKWTLWRGGRWVWVLIYRPLTTG